MRLLLFLLLIIGIKANAQDKAIVWVDIATVKNGHEKEALYFFENNWKLYRDSAIKQGAINSYKLLRSADSLNNVQIILMTEYPNKEAYDKRESFFQPIMKALRPSGPILFNDLKREDILTFTKSYYTELLHEKN